MRSAAAISGPIITTSRPRPAGRTRPIVELAILGEGDAPSAGRRARRDRDPLGRQHPRLLARRGGDRAPPSPPTAICKTGDIGYLDEDGYLFIVDRKKDIIIRGGENISAQEVEAAIYAHPAVSEAAVFGVADERLGEVPAAVVYCEKGGLDAEALRAFLAGASRPVQAAGPDLVLGRAAAQARHRQDRQGLAPGAVSGQGRGEPPDGRQEEGYAGISLLAVCLALRWPPAARQGRATGSASTASIAESR